MKKKKETQKKKIGNKYLEKLAAGNLTEAPTHLQESLKLEKQFKERRKDEPPITF